MKTFKKYIVIDFDGVIADYSEGWNNGIIGHVIPNTRESLEELKKLGYKIVVQSTRTHPRWGAKDFKERYFDLVTWLDLNRIPYDEIDIWGKALGEFYIDDRAIRFENNWKEIVKFIKNKTMK